ncbi:uncharacterized protein LOC119669710 [Teleopsis dalmanni]|uniref:uncharacterized protein LOC119669710 n=1 Tax=Teleopsis dalmanni TaxID=139649 RepID=UPI0018CF7DF0|nr:uncharacterized protein LOC119669710 [Teleopsis dalmanni]
MKYLITFCLLLTVTGIYIASADHILRLNKGALLSSTPEPTAMKSTTESKNTEFDKITEKTDDITEKSSNVVNDNITKQTEEDKITTTTTTTTENAPFISWSINF